MSEAVCSYRFITPLTTGVQTRHSPGRTVTRLLAMVHFTRLHVMAKFDAHKNLSDLTHPGCSCPRRLEPMPPNVLLKQSFPADCRPPNALPWRLNVNLVTFFSGRHQKPLAFQEGCAAYMSQLHAISCNRIVLYEDNKAQNVCQPYVQWCRTRHLWLNVSQLSGSDWLQSRHCRRIFCNKI